MNEINKEISSIQEELRMSETVTPFGLTADEQLELVLVVKDEEILVEKVLSPEEREKMEKLEAERFRLCCVCSLWSLLLTHVCCCCCGGCLLLFLFVVLFTYCCSSCW